MRKALIAIVEDEPIISETIRRMLTAMDYQTTKTASKYSEAIDIIETQQPDLVILDINLQGQLDGIELAGLIKRNFKIPFILISAFSDKSLLNRMADLKPAGFLTKPFTKEQLFSSVELALMQSAAGTGNTVATSNELTGEEKEDTESGVIFLKDGNRFHKLFTHQIAYIESDANYISVHLTDKSKILSRTTLNDFYQQLDRSIFIRIHRCYIVNRLVIKSIGNNEVILQEDSIPLSKTYKEDLYAKMGLQF